MTTKPDLFSPTGNHVHSEDEVKADQDVDAERVMFRPVAYL